MMRMIIKYLHSTFLLMFLLFAIRITVLKVEDNLSAVNTAHDHAEEDAATKVAMLDAEDIFYLKENCMSNISLGFLEVK